MSIGQKPLFLLSFNLLLMFKFFMLCLEYTPERNAKGLFFNFLSVVTKIS